MLCDPEEESMSKNLAIGSGMVIPEEVLIDLVTMISQMNNLPIESPFQNV